MELTVFEVVTFVWFTGALFMWLVQARRFYYRLFGGRKTAWKKARVSDDEWVDDKYEMHNGVVDLYNMFVEDGREPPSDRKLRAMIIAARAIAVMLSITVNAVFWPVLFIAEISAWRSKEG